MAKGRDRHHKHPGHSKTKGPTQRPPTVEYLLEQGTLQDMRAAKDRTAALLKYNWEYYSELALQRSQIQDELTKALIQPCISNYRFDKWQRAVKWKYGLHPLSTLGSCTYIGGRFNTGSDVNSEVPSFPALYLACDKDTALQETLGQMDVNGCGLTPRELALTNPQSEVIVSVSGVLEKVFDLRTAGSLKMFTALIKEFQLSNALKESAKFLGMSKPDVITQPNQLLETLLAGDWRVPPSMYDVPANPQIFGYLIYQAGIEGILYPSKLTSKDCLVVFPRNFAASSSNITFDDEAPHSKVPKRIDCTNWRVCELSARELIDDSA